MVKAHSLDQQSIFDVCAATIVARLTYCINAWWGYANAADRQRLQAVLNRAISCGYYDPSSLSIDQIAINRSMKLFHTVLTNPFHVLHQLLPPVKT